MALLRRGCVSAGLLGLLFVGEVLAAYKLALGAMSPFTGNEADLVTVHVHINPGPWNLSGHIFDGGSIIVPNEVPKKGKGQKPCGMNAAYCVCAVGAWISGKQLMAGNEIAYLGTLMYKQDITWKRLPGKLQVRFYARGYPLSGAGRGAVSSDAVEADAGSDHSFSIGPEAVPGGTTIRITGR
jgi:hypothetical protein